MHYHLEIIMPPTNDVRAAVEQILHPFREGGGDDDGPYQDAFWDWYVLGGRWSGAKLEATLGSEEVAKFSAMLCEKGVTVSGLVMGKHTLEPASQREMVDRLWCEAFPDSTVKECPLFSHYKSDALDVCRLDQMPPELTASHAIVAEPKFRGEGFEAGYMVTGSMWNGVNHVDTIWDGRVSSAIQGAVDRLSQAKSEYKAKRIPQPDWLVVTVDYHS